MQLPELFANNLSIYGKIPSQKAVVTIDKPVPTNTADAATRFATPYIFANTYAFMPGATEAVKTADRNAFSDRSL